MTGDELAKIAQKKCLDYQIPFELVAAIIDVETQWDYLKTSFDPRFRDASFVREHADWNRITPETEYANQATRWGVMGIRGSTVREMGFREHLTRLLEPELGLDFGLIYLRRLLQRYPDEMEAVAAYNLGGVIKTMGGMYRNQRYVDDVWQSLCELRALAGLT